MSDEVELNELIEAAEATPLLTGFAVAQASTPLLGEARVAMGAGMILAKTLEPKSEGLARSSSMLVGSMGPLGGIHLMRSGAITCIACGSAN
jgi:hypothetical protein